MYLYEAVRGRPLIHMKIVQSFKFLRECVKIKKEHIKNCLKI